MVSAYVTRRPNSNTITSKRVYLRRICFLRIIIINIAAACVQNTRPSDRNWFSYTETACIRIETLVTVFFPSFYPSGIGSDFKKNQMLRELWDDKPATTPLNSSNTLNQCKSTTEIIYARLFFGILKYYLF